MKAAPFFLILTLLLACGGTRLPPVSGVHDELNRCLRLSAKKKYQETVECLDVFKSRHPTSEYGAEADLLIADNYFRQKEYLLAAETYQEFAGRHSYHPKLDYAYYKSGLAYLQENPKPIDRDQKYLASAVKNFEIVVRYFPESPYTKLALDYYRKGRAKQAYKHFYVGRFYYKYSEYLASIPRFEAIVADFPGLGYDEKSFYYLTNAYLKTDQAEKAKEVLVAFEEQYPRSHWLKRAKGKGKK